MNYSGNYTGKIKFINSEFVSPTTKYGTPVMLAEYFSSSSLTLADTRSKVSSIKNIRRELVAWSIENTI
jgi:hypothetical protein